MPPRTPHSPSGNAGASLLARPVLRPGGDRSASFSSHDADRHPSATGAATFYADYLSSCEREGITPVPRADWAGIPATEGHERERLGAALVAKLSGGEPVIVREMHQGFTDPAPFSSGRFPDARHPASGRTLMSLEMEERMREEEIASANPLAVAAIIFFVSVAAFSSGVIAAPAVRQLLAMVL